MRPTQKAHYVEPRFYGRAGIAQSHHRPSWSLPTEGAGRRARAPWGSLAWAAGSLLILLAAVWA